MSIIITEILGTDSFSGSRLTINANFLALKSEVETIESVFGLSLASGNLDVSAATGGQIKGKVGAFNTLQLPVAGVPNITLTGSTGAVVANTLSLNSSLTVPNITLTLGGNLWNQGSTVFDGQVTNNDLVVFNDGFTRIKVDIGATNTHTVLNSDNIIIFDGTTSPAILTLTPDISLVDGHTFTLVKKGTGPCDLDTTNILGYASGTISFDTDPYKSSITLTWSLADGAWIVTGSNKMTLV